jgi:GTP cyclohydrolase II
MSIRKVAEADFPTRWGHFRIHGFEGLLPGTPATGSLDGTERRREEAIALVMGDVHSPDPAKAPLVRIHSQCLTGDVFHSLRCDCRQQLEMALSMIAEAGCGILIYEQQEGRGIGLMAKLEAYALQDQGLDTVEANVKLGYEADCRGYHMPVEILKALNVRRLRLLSNNPEKVEAVQSAGIEVVERVPADVESHERNEKYLRTKREKMGHLSTSE